MRQKLASKGAAVKNVPAPLYPSSPVGLYVLRLDGAEVMRGLEIACWNYIHRVHPFSVDHAIRHEGYSMEPLIESASVTPAHG